MLRTPRAAATSIAFLALLAFPSLASANDVECSDRGGRVSSRVNGNLIVDRDCEVTRSSINGNVEFEGPFEVKLVESLVRGNVECDGVGTAILRETFVIRNIDDCDGRRDERDDDDGSSETDDDGSETDDDGSGSDDDGTDDDGTDDDGTDDDGTDDDGTDDDGSDDDDSEFDDDDGSKPDDDDEDRALLATGFTFCDEGKAAVFPATNVGMSSVEVVVACFDPSEDTSGFAPEAGETTIEPGEAQVVVKPACINPEAGLGGELVRCTVTGDEDDVSQVRGVLHICNAFEVGAGGIELEDCGVTAAQFTESGDDDDDDDDDEFDR